MTHRPKHLGHVNLYVRNAERFRCLQVLKPTQERQPSRRPEWPSFIARTVGCRRYADDASRVMRHRAGSDLAGRGGSSGKAWHNHD